MRYDWVIMNDELEWPGITVINNSEEHASTSFRVEE
jgi:hypothetical protein